MDYDMKEIWKDITGRKGFYQVSNLGKVKSLQRVIVRKNGCNYSVKMKILKPGKDGHGYLLVNLFPGNKRIRIHALVLIAFLGNRPTGMEGCHNDGNPANNRLNNLRWDTHSANTIDAVKHGCNPNFKLNAAKVIWIRNNKHLLSGRNMAKKFMVSTATISNILTGKIWKYLLPKTQPRRLWDENNLIYFT